MPTEARLIYQKLAEMILDERGGYAHWHQDVPTTYITRYIYLVHSNSSRQYGPLPNSRANPKDIDINGIGSPASICEMGMVRYAYISDEYLSKSKWWEKDQNPPPPQYGDESRVVIPFLTAPRNLKFRVSDGCSRTSGSISLKQGQANFSLTKFSNSHYLAFAAFALSAVSYTYG